MSYYIAPQFLNKLAIHITKNFLELPGVRVPLILGIHGRKGEGKTFQCQLVFERMGIEVVHISGGELESPDAGDPARLIRLRYREAAELIKVRGRMAVVMINDLDAGAGRFDAGTQYTVNTQLVNTTLMNIADNPTNVQLPGSYDDKPLKRTPIIVTGNDFATLYAPLIREGRMEKFYWEPNRSDRIGIVSGIFEPDGFSARDIETLVDTFATQAIDFFSALRARVYDEQVLSFIESVGLEHLSKQVVNSTSGTPQLPKPQFQLDHLLELGRAMETEQSRVQEMRLVSEYNRALNDRSGMRAAPGSHSKPDAGIHASSNGSENGGDRPSTQVLSISPTVAAQPNGAASDSTPSGVSSPALSSDAIAHVRQLVNQGYRIGVEHVSERRFRTNSWQSCASIQGTSEQEAIAHLDACLHQFPNDYVRLIGIDPSAKRRVLETIIHRPSKATARY
ncbi:MAG: ribulose bisphosphate carboxylase small subunit [Cyanobacteria bacterium J06633_2]